MARPPAGPSAAALKRQPGRDMLILGSGELARTPRRHDRIDEYPLRVHPVTLGGGKRLFRDQGGPTAPRLVEGRTFGAGVVRLTHRRATDPAGRSEDEHGPGGVPGRP